MQIQAPRFLLKLSRYSHLVAGKQQCSIFATVSVFDAGTKLNPHRDPPVYGKKYRRVQIPLYIPSNECYMVWEGKKVFWKEGVPQIYDVMDHIHEGYNLSDDIMMFLFVDIEKRDDNSNLQEV